MTGMILFSHNDNNPGSILLKLIIMNLMNLPVLDTGDAICSEKLKLCNVEYESLVINPC